MKSYGIGSFYEFTLAMAKMLFALCKSTMPSLANSIWHYVEARAIWLVIFMGTNFLRPKFRFQKIFPVIIFAVGESGIRGLARGMLNS